MNNKICVIGINGRMGRLISELVQADPELELAGGIDLSPGEVLNLPVRADTAEFLDTAGIFVDFSNPAATMKYLPVITARNKTMVIGTTGFSEEEYKLIEKASRTTPILISPNMSVGVNLLFDIVERVTRILSEFDVEITEIHHRRKKDSPSGTAKRIAQIIAQAKNTSYDRIKKFRGEGATGPRGDSEVGISSIRGGDVVGEHSVMYFSDTEKIEITHSALSRSVFAAGTIEAVKYMLGKPAGLYSMKDVIGK